MEGAFTHLGNHLVSDSTSNIKFGDDESILDGLGGPRRRRNDDDESDVYDDDTESLASMPSMALAGANGKQPQQEEEVQLPPHACAYEYEQCIESELC